MKNEILKRHFTSIYHYIITLHYAKKNTPYIFLLQKQITRHIIVTSKLRHICLQLLSLQPLYTHNKSLCWR